jgi:hypothetical protein
MRGRTIRQFSETLRECYPMDVISPVKKGMKYPVNRYSNGSYGWHHFDMHMQNEREDHDYCIILHDICVVDVDSEEQVAQLLSLFPEELEWCPTVKTKRGRHFYFTRPPYADEEGYYDGAGQRIKGIDFKSVHSTGTGGVVMIPPSTGKFWMALDSKKMYDFDGPAEMIQNIRNMRNMRPIPRALLEHVALPRVVRFRGYLSFLPSAESPEVVDVMEVDTNVVHRLSYFDPMVDRTVPSSETEPFPVPCRRSDFLLLSHFMETDRFLLEDPSDDVDVAADRILAYADLLGHHNVKSMENRLTHGVSRTMYRLRDIHVPLFEAWLAEQPSSGAEQGLVTVDEALAGRLLYEPIDLPDDHGCRLYRGTYPKEIGKAGSRVLVEDPGRTVLSGMNPVVTNLLEMFPDRLVVAGGSVLGLVGRCVSAGNDVDIFPCGCSVMEAEEMLEVATDMFRESNSRNGFTDNVVRTKNAVTFLARSRRPGDGDKEDVVAVQFILRISESVFELLRQFDPWPSKVAFLRSSASSSFEVVAHPTWVVSMMTMTFPVDLTMWSESSVSRIIKYVGKGFDAVFPGLDFLTDRSPQAKRLPMDRVKMFGGGAMSLVVAEQEFIRSKKSIANRMTLRRKGIVVTAFRYAWRMFESDNNVKTEMLFPDLVPRPSLKDTYFALKYGESGRWASDYELKSLPSESFIWISRRLGTLYRTFKETWKGKATDVAPPEDKKGGGTQGFYVCPPNKAKGSALVRVFNPYLHSFRYKV